MGNHESQRGRGRKGSLQIWIFFLLLGLVVVGAVGWIGLRGQLAGYIFAHVGAVGVVGLLGVAMGYIAKRKGRDFVSAFLLGWLVPIVLGVAAVFAVCLVGGPGTPVYCGGSVSLAVSLLMLVVYSLLRRKTSQAM